MQLCVHDYACMSYAYPCPQGCHVHWHTCPRPGDVLLPIFTVENADTSLGYQNDFSPAYPASESTERNQEAEGATSSRYHRDLRPDKANERGMSFEQGHKSLKPQRGRLVATASFSLGLVLMEVLNQRDRG